MIPAQNIVAWSNLVPWTDARQVEQDLIISRAVVEIFSDPILREALRFRGGTALNKLHFPAPLRYSEDIDLVRTSHGPIGPVLDQLRVVLEPWLGRARFEQSPVAPKLRFRVEAEDASGVANPAERSRSTLARPKPSMRRRGCRSRSRIRGSPGGRSFRHSRGRKCWRLSFGRCCSGTGGAICTTLRTRLRSSKFSMLPVSSRCSVGNLALSGQTISRAQAPGPHVREVGQSAPPARRAPIAAGRSGGGSDRGIYSGGVSPCVHDPCRSASR